MYSLISIIFISLTINLAFAKVDPPNYNFSLDQLNEFMPGKPIEPILKSNRKQELIKKDGTTKLYRFEISYVRYKFPVFVQTKEEIIVDFYSRLPSYFSHDVFHQSLINRLGKQDSMVKKEELAIYIWKNKNDKKYVYSGTCTITCFPIYLYVSDNARKDFTPLIEQFEKQEQ